jgi:hypothetical protein
MQFIRILAALPETQTGGDLCAKTRTKSMAIARLNGNIVRGILRLLREAENGTD